MKNKCKTCGLEYTAGYHCCFNQLLWGPDYNTLAVKHKLEELYLKQIKDRLQHNSRINKIEATFRAIVELVGDE